VQTVREPRIAGRCGSGRHRFARSFRSRWRSCRGIARAGLRRWLRPSRGYAGALRWTEVVAKSTCGSAKTGSLETARMPASAIPIVSNVVATGRPMNGADSFIGVLHHPPSEVTILCQPIEIQIAYGNSDFDAQHDDLRDTPPPASRILFRPIATSRQWLASEMDAAPLAMEEDLEITVFLTRDSHLSPHVSQRFQRSLPDLGRSLSQESTSSLAQPRLYSPHMPIHRIFAQEPFGTVHQGKKLRMICIRWRHKPLIPAHHKHPCDLLTVRKCFDKVNDNFRLCLCVVIQPGDRLFQCPLPLLSCGRPPFTLFRLRRFLSSRSRTGGFALFGHELIPDGSFFSFQTVTFSSFLFGPHPRFGGLAVKRNIISAHGIAFTQPPEQPSEPHGAHSVP
jgi:hypothetical protein